MADYPNRLSGYSAQTPPPEDLVGDYGLNGPGGTDNRRMWNEKAVLDTTVNECAVTGPPQSLPSKHDAHRMGIYATSSVGDYD